MMALTNVYKHKNTKKERQKWSNGKGMCKVRGKVAECTDFSCGRNVLRKYIYARKVEYG